MNNIAIIVPHGDDEVLGFGGAVQKHLESGDHITVVTCRAPHDERTAIQLVDSIKAKEILGYQSIKNILLSEDNISNRPLDLYKSLEKVLCEIKPNIVYTTFWGDNHQDHKATYESVRRLIRVWGPLRVKRFLLGEIPSSTDQAPKLLFNTFLPNLYLPISSEQLNKKINAMQAYSTEQKYMPHPRSPYGIELLARNRGMECGHEFAECFMVIRDIL
jgi:LmbE family N-acetylglucosaminyl deacetylase